MEPAIRTTAALVLVAAPLVVFGQATAWESVHVGGFDLEVLRTEHRLVLVKPAEETPLSAGIPLDVVDLGGCSEVAELAEPAVVAAFARPEPVDWSVRAVTVYCLDEPEGRRFVAVGEETHHFGNRYMSIEHSLNFFRTTSGAGSSLERVPSRISVGTFGESDFFFEFLRSRGRVSGILAVEPWDPGGETRNVVRVHSLAGGEAEIKGDVVGIGRRHTEGDLELLILIRNGDRLSVIKATADSTLNTLKRAEDFGATADPVLKEPSLAEANLRLLRWFSQQNEYQGIDGSLLGKTVAREEESLAAEVDRYHTPCTELDQTQWERSWAEMVERIRAPVACSPWRVVNDRRWERMRIEHGNGRYVVLAPADTLATSADGREWVISEQPDDGMLADLQFNGEQFLAVGAGGQVWVSPDGASWKRHEPPTDQFLHVVLWTGAEWVLAGEKGTILDTEDLVRWHAVGVGDDVELRDGCVNNGTMVFVGNIGHRGVAVVGCDPLVRGWQISVLPTPLERVAWHKDRFIALESHGTLLESGDGLAWRASVSSESGGFSLVQRPHSECWIGPDGSIREAYTGKPPSKWLLSREFPAYEPELSELVSVGESLVAVGRSGEASPGAIVLFESWGRPSNTTDGRWPRPSDIVGVVSSDRGLLAMSSFAGYAMSSIDGQDWRWHGAVSNRITSPRPLPPTVWFGDRLVGFNDAGQVGSSRDGCTWSWAQLDVGKGKRAVRDVCVGQPGLVAVGDYGLVLFSADGVVWERVNAPEPLARRTLTDVVWAGEIFAAVGKESGIVSSPDGREWSYEPGPGRWGFDSLLVTGDRWVGVGPEGIFMRSGQDQWHAALPWSGSTHRNWRLVRDPGLGYFAVADDGTVLASLDAECWWHVVDGSFLDDRYVSSLVLHEGALIAASRQGILRSECHLQPLEGAASAAKTGCSATLIDQRPSATSPQR